MLSLLVMNEGQKNKRFWLDDDHDYFNQKRFGIPGVEGVKPSRQPPRYSNNSSPTSDLPQVVKKEITVKFELPKLGLVKALKKLFSKLGSIFYLNRYKIGLPVACFALIFSGIGVYNRLNGESSGGQPKTAVEGVATNEIQFNPALPAGKDELSSIKEYRVLQNGQVITFKDKFQQVDIVVNQQPAPEKIKTSDENFKNMAAELGATKAISTKQGTAYVATQEDINGQRVVAKQGGLLILITSTANLDDFAWQVYLNSLKTK